MSARVIIDLLPSGKPGRVHIEVSSEVSDGGTLTQPEIEFTLEQVLAGLRSGDFKLIEPGWILDDQALRQAINRKWTARHEGM